MTLVSWRHFGAPLGDWFREQANVKVTLTLVSSDGKTTQCEVLTTVEALDVSAERTKKKKNKKQRFKCVMYMFCFHYVVEWIAIGEHIG
jgi:hypothetical protein